MTPEERFERIEQLHLDIRRDLAEMAESQNESQKRHEAAQASHDSWLQDHERWMRDQELIVERQDQTHANHAKWLLDQEESFLRWKREMELTLKAITASQALTEHKLQAFIDSLRKGSNGHKQEGPQ